jgi:hypothetical protein
MYNYLLGSVLVEKSSKTVDMSLKSITFCNFIHYL